MIKCSGETCNKKIRETCWNYMRPEDHIEGTKTKNMKTNRLTCDNYDPIESAVYTRREES